MRFVLLFFSFLSLTHGQEAFDIKVEGVTRIQRCIMTGSSSRMIAVGTPERLSYSFDAQYCAPRFFWTGGFLNFAGELNGRGGSHCRVLGTLQEFGTQRVPFRVMRPDVAPSELVFQGFRKNAAAESPTFLFQVDGHAVEQTVVVESPERLVLDFHFPSLSPGSKFYLLDAKAHRRVELLDGLSWHSAGVISIPVGNERARIRLHLKPSPKAFVRKVKALSGEQLYKNYCSSCHSLDGSKRIGPSFVAMLGKSQTVLRDGREEVVRIDEDYLRESILEPQAAVVKGYESVPMASFKDVLKSEQIERLVTFLGEQAN